MSVCIAAITRENYIATISDTMVSHFLSSTDGAIVKVEPIHRDWAAMMAADDLTQCIPIVERAATYFKGRANTLRNARSSFKRAYQNHLAELAADRILGRFDMTMEAFLRTGRRRFTESQFNSLCGEVRAVKAECQFLVYGFDEKKKPHLFVVTEPGTDAVYDKPGFCAIGSGCYAAEGMLFFLGQTDFHTLPATLFNICAAKFMAEKTGVGADSFVFVKQYRREMFSMETWVLPTIRDTWEKRGKPRVPDGVVEHIASAHFYFGDPTARFGLQERSSITSSIDQA